MFKNKTVLLTGASGGIGSAFANALSNVGATMILVGRNTQRLQTLSENIGAQHHIVTADISMKSGRNHVISFCEQYENNIDFVINNAGISDFSTLENTCADDVDAIINTNLTSQILLCQGLLPLLLRQEQARIVNIGSTFGSIGFPGFSVYCASKFGLRGFSEALGRELMDSSVSVSYFAPRATKTTINNDIVVKMNNELGTKMDEPSLVAEELMIFLQSNNRRAYIGWPEKLFVRINALFPSIVDKSIFKQLPIIKRYLLKNN